MKADIGAAPKLRRCGMPEFSRTNTRDTALEYTTQRTQRKSETRTWLAVVITCGTLATLGSCAGLVDDTVGPPAEVPPARPSADYHALVGAAELATGRLGVLAVDIRICTGDSHTCRRGRSGSRVDAGLLRSNPKAVTAYVKRVFVVTLIVVYATTVSWCHVDTSLFRSC